MGDAWSSCYVILGGDKSVLLQWDQKIRVYKKSGLYSEPNPDFLQQTLVGILIEVKVEEHMAGRNPEQLNIAIPFSS